MNILVVDDEKEIADVIELYLKNDQYNVLKFYTGQEALDCIASTKIDLAILDIMLPDVDGFQILKQIREKYTFPVIMLTAKTEYMDKITGLTLGADDYIPKPFNPLELVARVKAQIRRYTQYNEGTKDEGDVICFLYTSDAADDRLCVDLGGRRSRTKKKRTGHTRNGQRKIRIMTAGNENIDARDE